ncbi:MAG: flagellar biosynthesis protein FliQ [Spirochaetia bacterium]|nr:flagellar biosynthesis protein FliQ [Spirochaetia bacterium]
MLESDVIKLITDALIITLKISAPMLIITMVVGLAVSILQTTTSIQEQTLTFVPKLIGAFVAITIFAAWMLHTAVDYTRGVFQLIQKY